MYVGCNFTQSQPTTHLSYYSTDFLSTDLVVQHLVQSSIGNEKVALLACDSL